MTVSRVMPPSTECASAGVSSTPSLTRNRFSPAPSLTVPSAAEPDAFGEPEALRFQRRSAGWRGSCRRPWPSPAACWAPRAARRRRTHRRRAPRSRPRGTCPIPRRRPPHRSAARSWARRRSRRSRGTRPGAGRRPRVRSLAAMTWRQASLICSGVKGIVDAVDLGRVEQAAGVVAQAEDRHALRASRRRARPRTPTSRSAARGRARAPWPSPRARACR